MTAAMFLAVSSARAEQVANPAYEAWSKFKVGTTVKLASETVAGTNTIKNTTTTKLLEITPDKAVVETTISMNMSGRVMDMPPQKQDIKAQIEKPSAATAAEAEKAKSATGEEDVKIGDKTYKTKWTEVNIVHNGVMVHLRTWMSDQVPGGVVKMTSNTEGANASSTKAEVAEVIEGK